MADGDKLGTIVNDPDFQKLSLSDQQGFLSKVDPDFGKIDSGQFATFLARYKGASQVQPPDAVAQARAQTAAQVQPVWSPSSAVKNLNTPLPRPPGGGEENVIASGAGPALTGLLAVGAPGATAGSYVGGYAAKKLAQSAGASPGWQTAAEIGGNLAGGFGGAGLENAGRAALQKVLPSARIAAAKQGFQEVSQAAGTHTVDVSGAGNVALEAQALGDAGGRVPKVMKDYLRRVTDPDKGPLTYDEARMFYQNATKQSTEELTRMNPLMRGKVAQFTRELGDSLNETAERAGKGEQLKQAMSNYSGAMKTKDAIRTYGVPLAKSAAVGAAGAIGAGGVYEFLQKLGILKQGAPR